eukprot:CAMPEP_0175828080 /NCGR_PEP_ID=MMETSP0107_2-20121207/12620_1 /TAXON_ID=195067 ORGANISM="Goniomonas pacifica, Strain CCMP1869" /NCGR_SAMPLE_ID=MMETSP0107_2 /ASSEMBLY_ACC=CAM_ASM_000203 /LENGTH=64 /DNA_ID=CAMNT_0017140787 /DNA_START=62 /DNA_END=255 /DNA_ORIENTATION=-
MCDSPEAVATVQKRVEHHVCVLDLGLAPAHEQGSSMDVRQKKRPARPKRGLNSTQQGLDQASMV